MKKKYTSIINSLIIVILCSQSHQRSSGNEISFLNGAYKHSKQGGGLGKSHLQFGSRYSFLLENHMHLYTDGEINLKHYTNAGVITPKNSYDILLGFGTRFYLDQLNDRTAPFLRAGIKIGSYNDSNAVNELLILSQKTFGLFYTASIGLRFSVTQIFFLDLETILLNNSLYSKTTNTHIVNDNGTKNSTEDSTTKNELSLNTSASLENINISIGMIL